MKHTKKLTIFSTVILCSLILSLIFPINALADDTTPPPVETSEVLPPTQEPTATEEPVIPEATPTAPVATEAPVTGEITPTEEAVEVDLVEIVAAAAENDIVLADTDGEPLTLATQESSELLATGDPFFWNGTQWIGYTTTGTGCPANVTCVADPKPFQAAVNNAPAGSTIYVASSIYTENVVINTANLSFQGYTNATVTSNTNSAISVTNGQATTTSFTLNAAFGNTSGVFAPSIFVNPGGTIQDGVDLVAIGGTVNVNPGTYQENVIIGPEKDGITISGNPGAPTVAGAAWNAPVLRGNNTGMGFNIYADDTTLTGLFIEDYAVGVQLNASGNATFTALNNTITGNGIGVYNANAVPGVDLHYNIFADNGYAIKNVDKGGAQYIEAQNNYWGCAAGPVIEHTYEDNKKVKHTDYYQWTLNGPHDANGDKIWDELIPNFNPAQSDCEVLVGDNEQGWDLNAFGWSPFKIKLQGFLTTTEACPVGYTGTYPDCVAPVLDAVNDSDTTNEGTPVTTSVLVNDSLGVLPTTITGNTQGANGAVSCTIIQCTYTPNPGFSGTDTYTYTITDSTGSTDTATVTITVNLVDEVPIAVNDTTSTAEDTPVSGSVIGNDTPSGDGGNVWTKLTDPTNGNVTFNPNGSYTYTPNANWSGTDSFTYELCDIDGDCSTATVTITVGAVDEAPVALDDATSTAEDTPVSGSVAGNDTLSGDGGNAWGKLSDPAHGTVTFNSDGSYTYTPNANWNGTDSFTYQLCDTDGDCSTATVTITVGAVDEAPVAVDDSTNTTEDTPVSGSVAGNDTPSGDGGNAWSQTSNPTNGTLTFNTDGSYTYTPTLNWSGTDSFTYQLCDIDGDCSSATVTIVVAPADDLPVANDDKNSTLENTPVSGNAAGNDIPSGDGGNSWAKLTNPGNGTVTFNPNGTYTYTPSANWSGIDNFTYQLCDGDGDCSTATVTIAVGAVDDVPVAVDDATSTPEDTPVSGDAAGNDALSNDGGNTWTKITDPAHGTVTFNSNGTYTYTPGANWSGTDSFNYELCDVDGDCSSATVTITVNPVDEAPVAADDTNSTTEDTPVSGSVIGNDTLSGDGGNSWSKLTDPAHGLVTFNTDGTYTYTPAANWNGIDSFTYQLCDADGDCSTATVTITVTSVDEAPVALDDSNNTTEDTPVSGSVIGNDALSGDGGNLWSQLTGPANGTLTFNADGSYTYTPNPDWNGTDSFTYQLCDFDGDCSTATVNIVVTPVDDLPVAANDSASTAEDTPVSGSVASNDIPSGDGGNAWAKLTDPANGTVTFNADGTYTYNPNPNWNGTDSFTYQLCDADGDCSTATVTITVDPVDDVPVAANDTNSTLEDTPVTDSAAGNDTPSGDGGHVWTKLTDPTNGTLAFNADGAYTYTPNANWYGTDSFTYELCDTDGDCSTATVTITVTAEDDLPVAQDDNASTEQNKSVDGSVIGNDTLSGDGENSWSQLTDPANGTVTFDPNGNYTYNPNPGWSGTDSFTYQLCDMDEDCSTATVSIFVGNLPDAVNDSSQTNEGTPVTTDVLANDDLGVPTTAITGNTNGANGTVTCTATQCAYTPNAGFSGTDTYTYTITDSNGNSATATVVITVKARSVPGCTDPTALNFNPLATVSDGTCKYSSPRVPLVSFFTGIVPVTGGETHAIAAGIAHTCAITPEGGVQCWGNNEFGQLGDGTNTASNVPVNVAGIGGGTTIVAGGNHTCVLSGGDVWCWGQNSQGQLGDGTTMDRNTPVKVLSDVIDITAGLDYTCAVMAQGPVMCWGNNDQGQLADGTKTDHTQPTLATLLSNISNLDAGQNKSCGLTSTGLLRCLSGGSAQELNGLSETSLDVAVNRFGSTVLALVEDGIPVAFQAGRFKTINDVTNAVDVDSGQGHACTLIYDGTVKCWGSNTYGQLGINSKASNQNPQQVVNVSSAWQLAVGKYHACVMTASTTPGTNDIQCWGLNKDGQLGNGTNTNSLVPVFVK